MYSQSHTLFKIINFRNQKLNKVLPSQPVISSPTQGIVPRNLYQTVAVPITVPEVSKVQPNGQKVPHAELPSGNSAVTINGSPKMGAEMTAVQNVTNKLGGYPLHLSTEYSDPVPLKEAGVPASQNLPLEVPQEPRKTQVFKMTAPKQPVMGNNGKPFQVCVKNPNLRNNLCK